MTKRKNYLSTNEDISQEDYERKVIMESLKVITLEALATDGSHHKQWYLIEMAKLLGYEEKYIKEEFLPGVPP